MAGFASLNPPYEAQGEEARLGPPFPHVRGEVKQRPTGLDAVARSSFSPRGGEGRDEGAWPLSSNSRQRPLTLVRSAHSTYPRAAGRGEATSNRTPRPLAAPSPRAVDEKAGMRGSARIKILDCLSLRRHAGHCFVCRASGTRPPPRSSPFRGGSCGRLAHGVTTLGVTKVSASAACDSLRLQGESQSGGLLTREM